METSEVQRGSDMAKVIQSASKSGIRTHIWSTLKFTLFLLPRGGQIVAVGDQTGNVLGFVSRSLHYSALLL